MAEWFLRGTGWGALLMLYEYAIEPAAIAADWDTCRYLAEKFGFDRGRLLSLFPKNWLKRAIEASGHLPDVEKKKVEVKLTKLKRDASIRSGRNYDSTNGTWLQKALAQQTTDPFHAIIAHENPTSDARVLLVDEVDETNPLIDVSHDAVIPRDVPSLVAAMKLLLQSANTVLFVDPYYNPFNARYQNILHACLKVVHEGNPDAACEVHYVLEKGPPTDAIEREAGMKFAKVIPDGMAISIFCWREKERGEDFHARYVLTDKGGIAIDTGLSAEGSHQTTDMHLMSRNRLEQKTQALARSAIVYELVEPILRIDASCAVIHL
jgi:hypothetical protein